MDGSAVHMSSIGRWAGKMDQVGFIFLRGPGPGQARARPDKSPIALDPGPDPPIFFL